jgi:NADPH:quinone reductase-like Zn-dependent oxidoreductase
MTQRHGSMKAFLIRKYKGPLEQTEVPTPEIGPDDVLVEIAASSLNQLDEMLRVGTFKATLPYPMPLILGNDFAGRVIAVGAQVSNFKIGDHVYGKPNQSRIGTFAEFIAVNQADIALQPTSISAAEAASLPLVGLTAWQAMVEKGGVKPGSKVLIHGGAGGVGSIAIQLAKYLGATVATTVGTANIDFVKALGADTVIDYKHQDFAQELSGFDLVLDTQGGETLLKSLSILRPGGKAIGIAGPPDAAFARSANLNPLLRFVIGLLSSKVVKKAKSLGVSYEFLWVHSSGPQLDKLSALVDSNKIKPILGRKFNFDQTPEALAVLATGKMGRGKGVVVIGSEA